ncbi:MAG TPA: hypothetical protein VGK19_22250 [Capsulimonadaceae bacterium]
MKVVGRISRIWFISVCLIATIARLNAQTVLSSSGGYSGEQGKNGWSYAAVLYSGADDLAKSQKPLVYSPKSDSWGLDVPGGGYIDFINKTQQKMTEGAAWFSLRYWTADKAYKVVKIASKLHATVTVTAQLKFVDAATQKTHDLVGGGSDKSATQATPQDIPLNYTLRDVQAGDRIYFLLHNWGNGSTGHGVMQTWDQEISVSTEAGVADQPAWLQAANRPVPPLHGRVGNVTASGKALKIDTTWNRLFAGRMWVGFLQEGALFGASAVTLTPSSTHTLTVNLPTNLPAGRVIVQCVPLGQPVAGTADAIYDVPDAQAAAHPVPVAWGVYRDLDMMMHPWSVSLAGTMSWDGDAFVPVGGMVNFPTSWMTKAGDNDGGAIETTSYPRQRARLELLKSYGIRDIYFNGFGYHSNPNALAATVAIAEQEGMRYGIGVATNPDLLDMGYAAQFDPIVVAANAPSAEIRVPCEVAHLRPSHRCLWALLSPANGVITSGAGVLTVVDSAKAAKPGQAATKDLVLTAKFPATHAAGKLVYLPELVMNASDPDAYFSGIDLHISRLKQVYGAVPLGAGMRMWVDPFGNEMFAFANQVSSAKQFTDGFTQWLIAKYGSIEKLNAAWAFAAASAPRGIGDVARLVPMNASAGSVTWIDSSTGRTYIGGDAKSEGLRDLALFRGHVGEEMLNRASNALKEIANVPVIIKHNCWFSDWFVNSHKTGGFDGLGYEPYCYGDSLAYHNSLVPYAEGLASARRQWTIVTETSPAAFDGQKDYVGYIDRLQMLDDFDQLLKFGAKGIYTFGFVFDPGSNFQVTELIRDPKQLEWLATYSKTLAAAPGLNDYQPEVYGWYPTYLRERDILKPKSNGVFGVEAPDYAMSGMYLGVATQIRMAPDGRWIVPAFLVDAGWKGLIAAAGLMTPGESSAVSKLAGATPVYRVGEAKGAPLDGFTATGIGVISKSPAWATLDEFRRDVLGYRVFQTSDVNGQTLPDGRVMLWVCAERKSATVKLPAGATAVSVAGKQVTVTAAGDGSSLTLTREPMVKQTADLPQTLTFGYWYPDNGQPETAIITGASVEQIVALNAPVWHRWLPDGVGADAVTAWKEAEQPDATTFVQPRVEGYTRYSGDAAISINTHFDPPAGQSYHADYTVKVSGPASAFWLRRQVQTSMDVQVWIDGRNVATIPAGDGKPVSSFDLSVWNAGTGGNGLKVGWYSIALPAAVSAGTHKVRLVALPGKKAAGAVDSKLLGGQAEQQAAKGASSHGLQVLQIDALMFAK